MNTIENKLLNTAPEFVLEALSNIEDNEISKLQNILIVLWQVHPDEAIQKKAEDLLIAILDANSMEQVNDIFSIFRSITTYFPWEGDYKDLQKENYQKFSKNKAPYEFILANSTVLISYYLDLGRKLFMLFELPQLAQDCFEGICRENPKNAEAFYALARLAEQRYDMDKAAEYYTKCLANDGEHLYANLQLGILKFQIEKDNEAAMNYYTKVVEIDPYMIEIYVRMAEACLAMDEMKRTKQFIEVALGINEYHEEALNLLGRIQWKEENDIEAAIETFEKGLDHKIHGDSGLLLGSLGELYATHFGENEKAKLFFEKSLIAQPKQPNILRKLVVLLETIYQDYGAIATHYETFLNNEKNNAAIYVEYADFLINYMHDYDFAKIQLEEALRIDAADEMGNKLARQIGGYIANDSNEENFEAEEELDDDDDFAGGGAVGDN